MCHRTPPPTSSSRPRLGEGRLQAGGERPPEVRPLSPAPWVLAAYIRSHGSLSASTSAISCCSRPRKLLSKRTSSSNTTTWARPLATTCGRQGGGAAL